MPDDEYVFETPAESPTSEGLIYTSIDTPDVSTSRRRWPWVLAGVSAVLVVALVGGGLLWTHRPVIIQTQHVKTGDVIRTFTVPGTVQSPEYAATFVNAGQIATVDVIVGQPVSAGDTLATLDATPFQTALSAAQAVLGADQTTLTDDQTNLTQVQTQSSDEQSAAFTTEQDAIIACNDVASCVDQAEQVYTAAVDKANAAVAAAQAEVDAASGKVTIDQQRVDAAQTALDGTTLNAPHDGTVASVAGVVGEQISNTVPFVMIVDTSAFGLSVPLTAAQAFDTHMGESATCVAGGQTLHGTTGFIAPTGVGTGANLLFPVSIALDAPSSEVLPLLSGESLPVTLYPVEVRGVLTIPAGAATYAAGTRGRHHVTATAITTAKQAAQDLLASIDPDKLEAEGSAIQTTYVLTHIHGQWNAVPVVLGVTDGKHTEVLAGLNDGNVVVTGETQ